MNSKTYSARDVNQVQLAAVLEGRDGQDLWVGGDVGKQQVRVVLNWAAGDFERPWAVTNPSQVGLLVDHLRQLAVGRTLVVALEPSGTYGDVLRQACGDAGIVVHRVSPKAAHDYAEVFDGVPSQHDGKDAAVVAELARLGKGRPWPPPDATPDAHRQVEYWVDRMDARRRLLQAWCGRIEGRTARHWPEALRHFKTTSPTLLKVLVEGGGPAGLAADPDAAAKLKRWSRNHLTAKTIERIIDGARRTVGVRQTEVDRQRLRDYAAEAADARSQIKAARKRLLALARDVGGPVEALAPAVGNATACVLFTYLGDPSGYPCAAAYVKAMGLNLTERSSGMYQGKLKISKRGSGAVRYWMYLAALRLVKRDSPVRAWYLRKKLRDRGESGRALVGVMRRLGLALWHVGVSGEAFDAKRLFPGGGGGGGGGDGGDGGDQHKGKTGRPPAAVPVKGG